MVRVRQALEAAAERLFTVGKGSFFFFGWALVGVISFGLERIGMYGPIAFGIATTLVFLIPFGIAYITLGLPPVGKR